MAIKSRLLSKLKSTYVTLNMAATSHSQKMHPVLHNLMEAKSLCQQGLTEENFAKYGEVYDGLIMAIQQILSCETGRDAREIVGLCEELLEHIVVETGKEEHFKKEMVFLPYKASMWDSLESVWRAAYEDRDNCLAYVIPIPYCDRNPDGTAKEWHCERDLFPKDVPTLDWQDVDLKYMHPDVIFYHYPYDNLNAATSTDSAYYSFNLKDCTDMQVYIPYFVVGRRWPELHVALSAYKYMDFMVVQQEHMQIAPMSFSEIKEGEEPYFEDFLPKEKILALGSPKIDRIFYCEKHPQVPQEWLDHIGDRKVIFYNTSISGILQQGERFQKKMAYIFSVFSKRNDVVLIWRPHPLMESCIQSVRPELYAGYMQLKQQFIDNKIGILDTTPDMEMTIAISDAYLGEGSSSVPSLFGYAGKPIFFVGDWLLWREPTLAERAALQVGAHIYDEEYSYFLAPGFNKFCRRDRAAGKIELLLDFGDTPDSKNYSTFIRDEDNRKFYFSPGSAKAFLIYDPDTGKRQELPFEEPLEYGNFGGVLKYEHYLYFLPSRYPAIIRLDEKTGELKYYRECLQEILPTVTAEHMELMGGCAWISYPNLVYISALQSNNVMKFDLATGEYSWQKVGPEDCDCGSMVEESYGCGIFWLFPWRTSKIRRWDTHTGKVEVLDKSDYPEGYQCQTDWWNFKDQYKFSMILRLDGYIWLLPAYGSMAMRLNMAEKKLEEVDLDLPFTWEERKSNYFMQQSPVLSVGGPWIPGYRPWNEDLPERAVQMTNDRKLYWYNFRTRTYRVEDWSLTEQQLREWSTPVGETFERCGIDVPYATGEKRETRSISQFIDYVREGRHDREKQRQAWSELAKNVDGTCGEKVKEEVLRRLG